MKKVIRIFFISLGTILLLLILIPFIFKGKIESIVKDQVNLSVEASVDWDKFSLSLLRGFPDLSINLHGMSLIGINEFEGDTLVSLKRFEFRANPFSAFRKNIEVKSILLDRPYINGIVLEDGLANYDIMPESEAKEEIEEEKDAEGGGTSMGVALKRFAIQNARISYKDALMGLDAYIGDFSLELKGDLSMDQTELNLLIDISGINAKMDGVRYMREGTIGVDILAAGDMVNSIYTLEKNEIRINGLILGAEGSVKMPEDGSIQPDLKFYTRETSFATLLSMVPAIYLQDFESLETGGSLELNGTVSGVLKDSILPDATLHLKVADGFFSYPELPKDVSDVQIALNVDFRGSDQDATTVALDKFHVLLGGNPFDIALNADHPFSDLHVSGMIKGMVDFASLKDVVPLDSIDLDGRLDADLKWDTKLSYIEEERYEEVDLDGRLIIEGVHIEAPDIPVPVELQKMSLLFNPRFVNLETLDLLLGSSDLHLDGELENFIPFVFDNQTVSGKLNLRSSLLDANEFLPAIESDSSNMDDELLSEELVPPPDSLAEPSQLKIPENMDFELTLDMTKLIYDNIVVEALIGKVGVSQGVAILEDLNMQVIEGTVALSGVVDPRGEFTAADLELHLLGIDIPAAYNTFVAIEKLAPIARHCQGKANVEMELRTLLDASFSPLYESIDADGHLYARDLKVEQPEAMLQLSSMLKNDKLKNLELEKADLRFAIREGRVIVEPFDMNFDDSKIIASGSHGIDQTMDYLLDMTIAKSDLGSGANELMNSVSALAAGAGFAVPQSDYVKVLANITGTFKNPKVRTDLSGNIRSGSETVRAAVEERVDEEIEKVEEQAREVVSEQAEDLIKKAEEEKARLVKEAEKAGERLVGEAKLRGDQLIEEAGSNRLKQIAAQRAAKELVEQAEKKAALLVSEAEKKGDALIEKAREESGKV